jgi:hypothetical protein
MKYTTEMGSKARIYTPSSIQTGSGIQFLTGGDSQTQIHRQCGDCTSLFSLFQNKESRLK